MRPKGVRLGDGMPRTRGILGHVRVATPGKDLSGVGSAAGKDQEPQANPGGSADPRGPRPRSSRQCLMRFVVEAGVTAVAPTEHGETVVTLADIAGRT